MAKNVQQTQLDTLSTSTSSQRLQTIHALLLMHACRTPCTGHTLSRQHEIEHGPYSLSAFSCLTSPARPTLPPTPSVTGSAYPKQSPQEPSSALPERPAAATPAGAVPAAPPATPDSAACNGSIA